MMIERMLGASSGEACVARLLDDEEVDAMVNDQVCDCEEDDCLKTHEEDAQ